MRARVESSADEVRVFYRRVAKTTWREVETLSKRAAAQPTKKMQKQALASLMDLSGEEKIRFVRKFVDRNARKRTTDWVAWVFVNGAIGRGSLPWTEADIIHVLKGVVADSHVLPPGFVVRVVKSLAKTGEMKVSTRALIKKAARSMWPPGATEGAEFKKAAAKLLAMES